MNKSSKILHLIAAGLLGVMAACSGGDPGSWQELDASGWRYTDTLNFDGDWSNADSLKVCVYHNDSYEYANIWVEMSYAPADTSLKADTVIADTFNILLADPDGRWRGSGNGLTLNYSQTVRPTHAIRPGTPIRLHHIMRTDSLRDLSKIGISK